MKEDNQAHTFADVAAIEQANNPQEAAQQAFDAYTAETLGNPSHAYWNGTHPQHQRAVEHWQTLYRLKSQGADTREPVEAAEQDGMDSAAQRQQAVREEGHAILSQMRDEHGYEYRDDVPDDLTPHERDLLRAHLQCVRGDWPTAMENIRKCMESGSIPSVFRQQYNELRAVPVEQQSHRLYLAQRLLVNLWRHERQSMGLPDRVTQWAEEAQAESQPNPSNLLDDYVEHQTEYEGERDEESEYEL